MSNSLSNRFRPALLPVPVFPAWPPAGNSGKARARFYSQNSDKLWDNALQFRREVDVDQTNQANTALQAIVALAQSRTGLFAQEVVIVKQRARQAVMAMRTWDGGVRFVSWRVNADGSLLRTGSSSLSLDGVQQIKMVHARHYVVACRTRNGEVHLSRWDVSNTGAIYPASMHSRCMQQVQWLEMAALTPDLLVTFGLTAAHSWQSLLWQLQGDRDLQLLQAHEIPAAAVSSCGLTILPTSDGTLRWATVVSATPTTLALHLWQYAPGATLTLLSTTQIATPEAASVIIAHVDRTHLRVAVQTVTGQLHLFPLRLAAGGQVIVEGDGLVLSEEVGQYVCQPHDDGFSLIHRTLAGVLVVQRWQPQPDGALLLVGAGHSRAMHPAEVTCCDEALEGNAPLLTGVIDDQGEVVLTTWR